MVNEHSRPTRRLNAPTRLPRTRSRGPLITHVISLPISTTCSIGWLRSCGANAPLDEVVGVTRAAPTPPVHTVCGAASLRAHPQRLDDLVPWVDARLALRGRRPSDTLQREACRVDRDGCR